MEYAGKTQNLGRSLGRKMLASTLQVIDVRLKRMCVGVPRFSYSYKSEFLLGSSCGGEGDIQPRYPGLPLKEWGLAPIGTHLGYIIQMTLN